MANDLTPIIPALVGSLTRVLGVRTGLLQAADSSYDTKSVKQGDTIKVPRVTSNGVGNITPSNIPPALDDSTEEEVSLTLSNYKGARFHLSGEERTAMQENGPDYVNKKVERHMHAILDDIESSLWTTAYIGAGFAATSANGLFSSDDKLLGLGTGVTALDQAGVPNDGDRSFVFGSTAQNALFGLNTPVVNTNEQGTDQTIRTGTFAPHFGANMRFSAYGNKSFTASGATGFTVDGVHTKGTKVIAVNVGTGTPIPGDIVAIGNFSYVIGAYSATDETITLISGLLEAVADSATITVAATSSRNLLLWRYGLIAAVRPPRVDDDAAVDQTIIVDPISGVSMRLAKYAGYHTSQWELSVVHGNAVNEPDALAVVY